MTSAFSSIFSSLPFNRMCKHVHAHIKTHVHIKSHQQHPIPKTSDQSQPIKHYTLYTHIAKGVPHWHWIIANTLCFLQVLHHIWLGNWRKWFRSTLVGSRNPRNHQASCNAHSEQPIGGFDFWFYCWKIFWFPLLHSNGVKYNIKSIFQINQYYFLFCYHT